MAKKAKMPAAAPVPVYAVDAFSAARLRASRLRPYFAQALASMSPVPVPGLGTMAVDRYWRVYYDPETTAKWGKKAAPVTIHEVAHLLRDHMGRADKYGTDLDVRAWGWSTDAEINQADFVGEMELPNGAILPQTIGCEPGGIAEEYYDHMVKSRPKGSGSEFDVDGSSKGDASESSSGTCPTRAGNGAKPGQHASGQASGGSSGGGTPSASDAPGQTPSDKPPESHGGCGGGSGVDGRTRPWELAPDDAQAPGLSEVDGNLIRRAVAQQIMAASRSAGKVPGGWRQWAETILEGPKVDWRTQLASCLRGQLSAAGVQDYSYARPSRRSGAGVVLPALRSRKPRVGVVIDTSSSMGDKDIADALAEVDGICKSLASDVFAVSCDSVVHACQRVTGGLQVRPAGGGGTDMGAGLAELERCGKIDVAVVLTDGQTPWPAQEPRCRTIVVLIGKFATGVETVPSWARAVVRDA
jgi:predicted metal-dependent peptidase